ncbi:hypothetical protein P3T37_000136 [Kitasatospora sp. MAA4]|uniref:DUF4232 domain-containing protein n=1 Tax=Kitasatospora sp. MAA4 TaxID=3035093 RepID=UPI0024762947|nr:DUF4232 domain-containing protein [Kitasatospora sp. MAA4]MDH6130769.1 hypothetical protein [Kitasatospora sp. MAA4]
MSARRLTASAVLATAALTLTLSACGPDGTTAAGQTSASPSAAGSPAGSVAASPASPGASAGSGAGGGAGAKPIAAGTPSPARSTARPSAGAAKGGGDTSSDAYAYAHPCAGEQVKVTAGFDAQLGGTKRLIQVTNTGSAACGLSFYPLVAIDNSATIGAGSGPGPVETVQPAVSTNLGDGQGYPLQAGKVAYAVLDLDPSHATAGASRLYNEVSVIASTKLPNAYTVSTAITEQGGSPGNPYVKSPFLGRYSDTIADASGDATPGR